MHQLVYNHNVLVEIDLLLKIIEKHKFVSTPWKNGKGKTTELAINSGGNLTDFDWRLSMAEVTEPCLFSDFAGYQRNLILIAGQQLQLCHDDQHIDHLTKVLDYAAFSGNCSTYARLPSGPIVDFNIITNAQKYSVAVTTSAIQRQVNIAEQGVSFVFGLSTAIEIEQGSKNRFCLKPGDLLQIENEPQITINGAMFIAVHLVNR